MDMGFGQDRQTVEKWQFTVWQVLRRLSCEREVDEGRSPALCTSWRQCTASRRHGLVQTHHLVPRWSLYSTPVNNVHKAALTAE